MTVFNARALASLVTVAGNALSRRLTVILNALVKVSEDNNEEELATAVEEAIQALFSSINDAEGLNTLMMLLIGWYVDTLFLTFHPIQMTIQGEEPAPQTPSQRMPFIHCIL